MFQLIPSPPTVERPTESIHHNIYTPKTIDGSMFSFWLIVRARDSECLVCQSDNVRVRILQPRTKLCRVQAYLGHQPEYLASNRQKFVNSFQCRTIFLFVFQFCHDIIIFWCQKNLTSKSILRSSFLTLEANIFNTLNYKYLFTNSIGDIIYIFS